MHVAALGRGMEPGVQGAEFCTMMMCTLCLQVFSVSAFQGGRTKLPFRRGNIKGDLMVVFVLVEI